MIEAFHKAMKTGCGLELAPFTTAHAPMVTIAIVSVVATQLLRLRDPARNPDAADRPAAEVIDQAYVDAAVGWRFTVPRPASLTAREFCMALAKLGGHLNRKGDGPPGWLALWRGWTKRQPIVDGMQIERRRRCV